MLSVNYIAPTHNRFRSTEVVEHYASFFREGRIIRCEPVKLFQIKNYSTIYCRDGHHRLGGLLKAGGSELMPCEYKLDVFPDFSYLTNANLYKGWITPFDPITECRLADFGEYKFLYEKYGHTVVKTKQNLYKEPRRVNSFKEFLDV